MTQYAVIDIETTGLNRYKDKITAVGILVQPEGVYKLLPSNEKERIIKLLERIKKERRIVITQNGNFDTLWLELVYGVKIPVHHDVMLMGTAYDLAEDHDLKSMAQEYLVVENWDVPLKVKKTWSTDMEQYLRYDLQYTWELFLYFDKNLLLKQRKVYEQLLKPAYTLYKGVERRGIYLDREKLKNVASEYAKKEEAAKKILDDKYPINWNSPQQVQKVLFEEECLPIRKYSKKTGAPSADAKSLKRLAAAGIELPKQLLGYKFYYGARTKFLTRWIEDSEYDGRIHPHFKLTNVVTGRTSCSDPNLQQVPRNKELRTLYTAQPGRILMEADYSQIELRFAAHYSNDPTMIEIYQKGGDIHTETAKQILGKRDITKEERNCAKAVNFGFVYGMQAPGFVDYAQDSYGVVFTKEQASRYRELYFLKYSRLLDWHKEMANLCEALGGVENLFGQFRRLPDIYSTEFFKRSAAERRAINTPVQGSANGLLLGAAVEIDKKLRKGADLWIVGTIHDSILMDVPEDSAKQLSEEVKRIMAHPQILDDFNIRLKVPVEADVGIGPWGSK
jgi:DNA polymerase-1